MLPLEGYRMLDLSRLLPGPVASNILADMGMEVIKVEETEPRYGMGRDVLTHPDPPPEQEVAWAAYNSLARNKKSVALNLLDPDLRPPSQEVFYRLAKDADVVLEGYRPHVVKWMGVDYETVRRHNPRIIYCSISGYGQHGPYIKRAGHDPQYCAVAGTTPPASLEAGQRGHGVPLADYSAGIYAAVGILGALIERDRSGEGQAIDIPMVATAMSFTRANSARFVREGSHHLGQGRAAGRFTYIQCSDGKYITTSNAETHFWENFCRVIDREVFIGLRDAVGPEVERMEEEVRAIFLTRTRDEWLRALWEADTCAAPVNDMAEALEDPQVREAGMVWEVDHPSEGRVRQMGFPIGFSRTPATFRSFAPTLGQDTQEVLQAAGYSDAEIAGLEARGIAKRWRGVPQEAPSGETAGA